MSMKINFNQEEKEVGLKAADIATGCYIAKHLSPNMHNRLIIVRHYRHKDVIMVFGRHDGFISTYDSIADAFNTYNDWKKVSVTMEVN